jgi:O-antigen ligase
MGTETARAVPGAPMTAVDVHAKAATGGRIPYALAALMLLLVPLVFDGSVPSPFRTPKAELAGVLWVALAAAFLLGGGARASRRDPWWLAWGGVVLGGLVSSLAGDQPLRCLANLLPLAVTAIGCAVLRQLPDERRRRLAALVVAAGVIQAVVTVLLLDHGLAEATFGLAGGASTRAAWLGTMGNPADVSVFLLLPTILAVTMALSENRHRGRLLAAAALMTGVIVGTRTLSTLLALVIALCVAFGRRLAPRRRLPAAAAVAVACAALLLAPPWRAKVAGELAEIRRYGWEGIGSSRGAAAVAALSMLASHPATGVGYGLFDRYSATYLDEDTLAARARNLGLETAFGEAHDDILQYAAETGLVGVLSAIAGLALAVRRNRGAGGVLPGRAELLIAAVVISALQFPLHLAGVAAQWAVLASLALPALAPPEQRSPDARRLRLGAVIAVAAVAAGLAWQRHLAWRSVQRGDDLVRAAAASSPPRPSPATLGLALAELRGRLPWLRFEHQAYTTAGNLAMRSGGSSEALQDFTTAVALAERAETRFNLGMALLALGDRASGLDDLMAAVKLNPVLFSMVGDPELSRALRRRLDADGYGGRHAWLYEGTPAATP